MAGFDFVKAVWKTLVAIFTGDFTGVGDAWAKVWKDIVALAQWWEKSLIAIAKAVGQAFKDYFLRVFEDIKSIWTWMKGFSWSGIKKMFAEGKDAATAYGQAQSTGQAGGAGGYAGVAAATAAAQSASAEMPLSPDALKAVQAERASVVADLQRPELRNLVSATLATEAGGAEDQKNILEALVNRGVAQQRAGTYKGVEHMIKGGFYGPYNRGETNAVMARGLSDARSEQVGEMIKQMGAGRNALGGLTDQGMVNEIKGNIKEQHGEDYFGKLGIAGEEQTAFRDTVRKMVVKHVAPIAAEIDETDRFPLELVKLFGEMGLMQLWVPERYGGPNGNLTMACLAREEISSFVAVPLAGMTLGQLGAEVVRVDPIGGAADYRRWPVAEDGTSIYWAGLNKGKRSVAADLRSAEGQDLVQRLIADSGVLITNVAGREWHSYDNLTRLRPDLIHVEVSGRADGGTGVDYTVNAGLGFPLVTGPAELANPVNHVLPAWDVACGIYAALAVVAALRHRDATGQGQRISIPLENVALATAGTLSFLTEVMVNGTARERIGNSIYGQYGQDFTSSDGVSFMIVALTRRHFRDLTELTGMDRSALSKLETGHRANPTVETLVRYAEAVGKRLVVSLADA
jgi:hypothetical protein